MEEQRKGKTLYVVLALICAGIIVGGATWFYVQGNTGTDDAASIQTAPTESAASDSETANTELTNGLTELDEEIAAIEVEEESDDDSIDY